MMMLNQINPVFAYWLLHVMGDRLLQEHEGYAQSYIVFMPGLWG